MELRQLHYFRAIAEAEHFGRASARLGIAQPALSRQVRLLEDELGLALFERLPRGVRLTAAGHVLLGHCRQLAGALDRAVTETRAAAAGTAGTLRLGFIEVAAWHGIVPDAIRSFRAEVPGVALALSSLSSGAQLQALREQRLDGGILYNPPEDPGLISIPLERHPVMLALPADDPLAAAASIRLADLAGRAFIGFQRAESPRYFDDLAGALATAGFAGQEVAQMHSEADMLALVHAGAGLAFVNSCQRWRPPDGIAFRPVEDLDVGLDLCLVHARSLSSPPLERFIALLPDRA
ncbi:LysR family transcriptional regulator [Rhizobium halophytocola]|uniref:DNA-binding transcriptional LysR family regulator n=1 Tax=Rhizobium halophytocola TaxID=735519 RepID=A0ABS4DVB2_9HYPH|nr:LysR family transcriptional regulator [Rhizobium halophytocola]MBP1849605.1 DNA-binding transcriptional LysR family regulator [Rhizobium halophytocola]